MKVISLLLVIAFFKISCCEFFSSTAELKNLEKNESKLIKLLKDFVTELEDNTIYIKTFIEQLEGEHTLLTRDIETYLFNPLNSFSLIKRLSNDIEKLENNFKFVGDFFTKFNEIKLPSSELNGAIEGLYRLQKTYELKSENFVKGFIVDKQYGNGLSTSDLLIAAQGLMEVDENYAFEYIKIAKESISSFDKISKIKFLEELFDVYNSNFHYELALKTLGEIKEIDKNYSKFEKKEKEVKILLSNNNFDSISENDNFDKYSGSYWTEEKENLIVSKACQQKLAKSPNEISQLSCRYISKTAFAKIAPFKIMEANLNPYIIVYIDVISDKEIELLKSISQDNLQRAPYTVSENSTYGYSKYRIAKLSWPEDRKFKILKTLTTRVNDMTGLSMASAESWQIQNYGIGGFYTPHHDFAHRGQFLDGNTGNRIATMLFYLSDVEKGGGTAFPLLRVYVPPRKGTAAFWYNLSTSGNREYLTFHTACPVLIGSKWVANKWIREREQELIRPCELEPKLTEWDFYNTKYNLKDYGINI